MSKRLRLGEFLLGVQGLALLRNLFQGTDEHAEARIAEMREILAAMDAGDPEALENLEVDTHELSAADGYALWAASYDDLEQPVVDAEARELADVLAPLPPGRALDVGAGTGRVALLLRALGHDVTAVDPSPEMLQILRSKAPDLAVACRPLDASIAALGTFDLVTCTLTLGHLANLGPAVAALASTVRPGGTLVITDVHPLAALLDGQAWFPVDGGVTPWIRNHHHGMAASLRAFTAAGLQVVDCREPIPADGEGPMRSMVALARPDAARSAYAGLPSSVVWVLRRADGA